MPSLFQDLTQEDVQTLQHEHAVRPEVSRNIQGSLTGDFEMRVHLLYVAAFVLWMGLGWFLGTSLDLSGSRLCYWLALFALCYGVVAWARSWDQSDGPWKVVLLKLLQVTDNMARPRGIEVTPETKIWELPFSYDERCEWLDRVEEALPGSRGIDSYRRLEFPLKKVAKLIAEAQEEQRL